jgi:hypothetical protein
MPGVASAAAGPPLRQHLASGGAGAALPAAPVATGSDAANQKNDQCDDQDGAQDSATDVHSALLVCLGAHLNTAIVSRLDAGARSRFVRQRADALPPSQP